MTVASSNIAPKEPYDQTYPRILRSPSLMSRRTSWSLIRSPFNGLKTRGRAYKSISSSNMEASLKGNRSILHSTPLLLHPEYPLHSRKIWSILKQIPILPMRILPRRQRTSFQARSEPSGAEKERGRSVERLHQKLYKKRSDERQLIRN